MIKNKVAIIGGGPSALFIVKKFVEAGQANFAIDIFEKSTALGMGMPYSASGAVNAHITNVSSDEVPALLETLQQWVKKQDPKFLQTFQIDIKHFHEKTVVPRLLLGVYLEAQMEKLIHRGQDIGLDIKVHLRSKVVDINVKHGETKYDVLLDKSSHENFDKIIICTGHEWPKRNELTYKGYYDSPYPPQKLNKIFNHPICLKGGSLTAIDAVRSLCAANGNFVVRNKRLKFETFKHADDFKIVIHTLDGLLPSVRFHVDKPLVSTRGMLTDEQIETHKAKNQGFLSLDYLFEQNFKNILKQTDAKFYETIANMDLETFVNWVLKSRMAFDPITLLKIEFIQAKQSIADERTISWKKLLALFSYSVNHPAKYLCGEDMLKLTDKVQALIAIIIADIPHSSAEQLLALHHSGRLEIVAVPQNSDVTAVRDHHFYFGPKDDSHHKKQSTFNTFIDCTGQRGLSPKTFPFQSMFSKRPASAKITFKDQQHAVKLVESGMKNIEIDSGDEYWLVLKGFAINDYFQFIYEDGTICKNSFMMAVPYISGFNPDYSGFDFCDQASSIIVDKLVAEAQYKLLI